MTIISNHWYKNLSTYHFTFFHTKVLFMLSQRSIPTRQYLSEFNGDLLLPIVPTFDLASFAAKIPTCTWCVVLPRIETIPIATPDVTLFLGAPFHGRKFVPIRNRNRSRNARIQFVSNTESECGSFCP